MWIQDHNLTDKCKPLVKQVIKCHLSSDLKSRCLYVGTFSTDAERPALVHNLSNKVQPHWEILMTSQDGFIDVNLPHIYRPHLSSRASVFQ